ncbi:MAG: hypothetical protein AAF915_02005 [Cyanobacteria bacterium P01_D01_bin.50]
MVNSVRWLKVNVYLACVISLWLAALSPIGKLGKGIALTFSLCSAIKLIKASEMMIYIESMAIAQKAMRDELSQVELALRTHQEENELERLYNSTETATYPAEVAEDLREALEVLINQEPKDLTSELRTLEGEKRLYLAVKSLKEAGKSDTFVIENVLRCGGEKWNEGKQYLQHLLKLGKHHEW